MKTGILTDFEGNSRFSITTSSDEALGGDLTLIESKYITDDTQTVSFTGLDGDADKFYYLIIKAVTSTAHSMYLNFNNSSSNLSAITHGISVSLANALTHTPIYYNTTIPIFGSSYTGYQYFATISIDAKSGANRYSFMNLLGSNPANFKIINNQTAGKWENTSDNLTSIDLVGTVSNSLLSGSTLHLYRGLI